jgi:hypothetical protein
VRIRARRKLVRTFSLALGDAPLDGRKRVGGRRRFIRLEVARTNARRAVVVRRVRHGRKRRELVGCEQPLLQHRELLQARRLPPLHPRYTATAR